MSQISDLPENQNGLFRFHNAVLRVEGDIYWENVGDFEAMAADCLASDSELLVVDLSEASFVSSSFVGCLTDFLISAKRAGKQVKIVATTDTSWLLEIMGSQNLFRLELA